MAIALLHLLPTPPQFNKGREEKGGAERKGEGRGRKRGTFLVVQWLRLHSPNAGALGSIPPQRTRSHMPQLRLKILHAATKTQSSQIHK